MLKRIPKYVWICFISLFALDFLTYYLTQTLTQNRTLYDLTINFFDNKVPFLSSFVIFYIIAYPFWVITPFIISKLDKKDYLDWSISVFIIFIIVFCIYLIIPTTIVRPVVDNTNIFNRLVNIIYLSDSPERPTNLFPSIHCFLSWMCYIGVRNNKKFSKTIRISFLSLAVLICLSTQFIKQHYIVDLVSAIFLCELVFVIVKKTNISKYLMEGVK